MENIPEQNTDVEIFREVEDDYYSPSVHKTIDGKIGINVGGSVYVMSVRDWHTLRKENERLTELSVNQAIDIAETKQQLKRAVDIIKECRRDFDLWIPFEKTCDAFLQSLERDKDKL